MHHCSFELSRYEDTKDEVFVDHQSIDPVEILQRAYEKSLNESKQEGIIGSTTALVAILRDDELRIANLGDCCCSIIRGNDYIFRSEEQQHSFNYPVQIGTNSKSTPLKHAQRYNIKVQKDDIVILSSDGLVDNLFDEDILEEVIKIKPFQPEKVSEALALRAKTVSIDQFAVASPFSQRANEEGIHYVGGKNDDISVVVAVVRDLWIHISFIHNEKIKKPHERIYVFGLVWVGILGFLKGVSLLVRICWFKKMYGLLSYFFSRFLFVFEKM